MQFTHPDLHSQRTPEPPAMVQTVSRSDVTWNRPVFKAPSLDVVPPKIDAQSVAQELRRMMRAERGEPRRS